MRNFAGNEYHHKVRKFERIAHRGNESDSLFQEVDGFVSMKISAYFSYLEKRAKANNGDNTFTYTPFNQNDPVVINPHKTGLYMIDFDLVKLLPRCYDDFIGSFKIPGILPGGENCMMNAVSLQECCYIMGLDLYSRSQSYRSL